MSDYQDDEALARLRAADPATGAHPDLHKMTARLRGRTPLGDSQTGQLPGSTHRPVTGSDYRAAYSASDSSSSAVHISDPGVRTGRSGLLVAAAVAAVALGGGGYAVGAATAGGDDGGGTSVASSTQDSDSGSDAGGADASGDQHPALMGAAEDAAERAMGDEHYVGGDAGMSAEGGGYAGPAVPVAGAGLSTERTTGPVYAVQVGDTDAASAPDLLRQYADGLGIDGEIVDDGTDSSSVTDSTDGRMLNVYNYSGLTIDYSNPALDPYCDQMMADMAESDEGYGWFGPGSPTEIECVPAGELPDDEAAIAAAQEFLTQAGVDYSGLEFTVDSYDDAAMFGAGDESSTGESGDGESGDDESRNDEEASTAEGDAAASTANPAIDSELLEDYQSMIDADITDVPVTVTDPNSPLSAYRSWHFSVASGGVVYASLLLGDFAELGTYEVISPTEAVTRATDARYQQMGAYIPDLEYIYPADQWDEPAKLPPVSPGEPIPYPLSESTVTSVELHTGVLSLWDGTEFLVPMYALSDGKGNYWEVLGLAEEALDFTP